MVLYYGLMTHPSTYFIYFARKHMIKNTQVAQFANSSGSFSEFRRLDKLTQTYR